MVAILEPVWDGVCPFHAGRNVALGEQAGFQHTPRGWHYPG